MTKSKQGLLPLVLVAIGLAVVLISFFWEVSISQSNPSTSNVKPVNPAYLNFTAGNVSKIFLVSAEPKYGYWTKNDAHMDWFTNGPIIHTGDPVFIVKATVRNDYTQNDKNRVNSMNHSSAYFNVKLYNKNNTVIPALQAYPKADTVFKTNGFYIESGKLETFELYFATSNLNIDHYEILVWTVSGQPVP